MHVLKSSNIVAAKEHLNYFEIIKASSSKSMKKKNCGFLIKNISLELLNTIKL